jgi:MoxR-like ATPase
MERDMQALAEAIERESESLQTVLEEVRKIIVGQRHLLERMMIGLLCNGHILLEGVPGLAKTLSVSTLAQALDVGFKRIQFTPDLLPADITGTLIYNQKEGTFEPRLGPIHTNMVLADEINRAPAKVQSALLEAMQERQITIGEKTYALPQPFLVMATQNPIEQEGTYTLPEAQVDRFMLKVKVEYPSKSEERRILDRMTEGTTETVEAVLSPAQILKSREIVRSVYIDEKIKDYIVDIVFATRYPAEYGLPLREMIQYGASPRASLALTDAAKAYAFINGRAFVTPEDIKAIGVDVLRHRIIPTYEAEAESISTEEIISQIFNHIPVP